MTHLMLRGTRPEEARRAGAAEGIANVDLSKAIRFAPVMQYLSVDLPLVRSVNVTEDGRPKDKTGRARSSATMPKYGQRPGNAGKTYNADPPTDEEFALILANVTRGQCGERDYALFTLLRWSGLRISEGLDLRPHDLDLETGAVTVQCGKGSKFGISALAPHAIPVVRDWLTRREQLGFSWEQPVFPIMHGKTRGQTMSSCGPRLALKKAGAKAGLTKRMACHQLRHAFAVDLARRGVPLPYISKALRHSNIATTATYLASISAHEVVAALAGIDWQGVAVEDPEALDELDAEIVNGEVIPDPPSVLRPGTTAGPNINHKEYL